MTPRSIALDPILWLPHSSCPPFLNVSWALEVVFVFEAVFLVAQAFHECPLYLRLAMSSIHLCPKCCNCRQVQLCLVQESIFLLFSASGNHSQSVVRGSFHLQGHQWWSSSFYWAISLICCLLLFKAGPCDSIRSHCIMQTNFRTTQLATLIFSSFKIVY